MLRSLAVSLAVCLVAVNVSVAWPAENKEELERGDAALVDELIAQLDAELETRQELPEETCLIAVNGGCGDNGCNYIFVSDPEESPPTFRVDVVVFYNGYNLVNWAAKNNGYPVVWGQKEFHHYGYDRLWGVKFTAADGKTYRIRFDIRDYQVTKACLELQQEEPKA